MNNIYFSVFFFLFCSSLTLGQERLDTATIESIVNYNFNGFEHNEKIVRLERKFFKLNSISKCFILLSLINDKKEEKLILDRIDKIIENLAKKGFYIIILYGNKSYEKALMKNKRSNDNFFYISLGNNCNLSKKFIKIAKGINKKTKKIEASLSLGVER